MTTKFYQRKTFWIVFILVYTIVLFRFFNSGIHDEGDVRGWHYGDTFSAKNVECSAHYYVDSGFVNHYGLPSYGYNDGIEWNEYVYTHYPPLAEWIAGAFAIATGYWQAQYLAIFPLLLSVLLFFIIYKFLEELIPNRDIGFIGAVFITTSAYFVAWADDIHQHLYIELLRWSFVYLWWRFLKFDTSAWNIVWLSLFYFCLGLVSFEPYVYMAVVVVGFSMVLKKKWISWPIVILLSMPVLAFVLRLGLNALHLGSIQAMITDMTEAFNLRVGGHSVRSELGRCMNGYDYFVRLPWERFRRLGYFFTLPSAVVILVSIYGMYKIRQYNKELFKLTIVLYIASISWIIVMVQHALIHIFTTRHLGLFLAIASGFGIYYYFDLYKRLWQARSKWLWLHIPLLMYAIGHAAYTTIFTLYLKFGLLYPHLGIHK